MPDSSVVQAALFSLTLLTASVWDIKRRIIPDSVCVLLALTWLVVPVPARLTGIFAALPLLVAALWKEGGMGGGDIKLTEAAGIIVGLPLGILGLCLGLAAALVYYAAGVCICRLRGRQMKKALPLAPFLSAGFATIYFINFGGIS